jgi:hypothetical protein
LHRLEEAGEKGKDARKDEFYQKEKSKHSTLPVTCFSLLFTGASLVGLPWSLPVKAATLTSTHTGD